MAIAVRWSPEAQETFGQNIIYLKEAWGDSEISKFVQETERVINRLQSFPESYPSGRNSKKYRRARLNKYIVLFYQYNKRAQQITLLTFWNVKQSPNKLKL